MQGFGKGRNGLWLRGIAGAIIVLVVFLAMTLRVRLSSVHPNLALAHMFNRPSFWLVALLSVLIGLAFGGIRENFRPLVAVLAVVIMFILILGAELLFLTRSAGIRDNRPRVALCRMTNHRGKPPTKDRGF